MPERYESLRLRLQIEYGRLLDWSEAAGIIDSPDMFDEKMKVNGVTVMALLSEMRSLLKKMRAYLLRYDDTVRPLPQGVETRMRVRPIDMVDLKQYKAIFESKDIPQSKRKYPKGLNRLVELASGSGDIAKQPKRIRWATIDEKAFKEDLDRMSKLTNFLHETLGDHQMKLLVETTRETYLALLQLTKEIRQMKVVAGVAPEPRITESEYEYNGSIFSQAETLVDDSSWSNHSKKATGSVFRGMTVFEQLANFRAVNTSLYREQNTDSLLIPKIDQAKDLTNKTELGDNLRMAAVYQGRNVWVEWKSYQRDDMIMTQTNIIYQLSDRVRQDAERLVGLLRAKEKPAEFCVPDCAGYFDDSANDRFGFVYEVRDASLRAFQPKSLLQLFSSKPASLNSRITLAQRLATSLLYLHATNWLHKSLRSASVLFFNADGSADLRNPFISSFEYSRPDNNNATITGAPEKTEWAVYCHPDYLGRPGHFRKSYDIYSLGIILLELAFWKPAEEVFGIEPLISENEADLENVPTHIFAAELPVDRARNGLNEMKQLEDTTKDRSSRKRNQKIAEIRNLILLDEASGGQPLYLEHVRNTMGERYTSAVKACIGGLDFFHLPSEVDQTDPIIATLLQQAYLRLVVDVLNAIVV